ncbi:MAG: efflux RND transporter permease subunit [Planctomycetes bacterium]|nr:efflux RND transporter permease subunit [Planctomycetota bacterium]
MLTRIIEFSLANRFLVLIGAFAIVAAGAFAIKETPIDAIPDLSDVQVIVFTEYPGQAPRIVEDQVTYPITTKMLSVPHAKVVRGYSFFGYSFVYVIFEDGTDMYWARSRVLEYLNSVKGDLPEGVNPTLGPDATGVGWAFMYTLESENHDLYELRSIQDWYLRYALLTVEGVSEVASIGGQVKQYQVTVDPDRLRGYGLTLRDLQRAIKESNNEVGGRTIEMAEREFIVRATGYLSSVEDLRQAAVGVGSNGTPILLGDVADITLGPEIRRGLADSNGEGEAVGGIVIVRYGADTRQVIEDTKAKLEELKRSLPEGVTVKVTYDRSGLIDEAVETLVEKLIEESIVVAFVCVLFLLHFRSALVAILVLPLAVLLSLTVMKIQGIGANIMSLGGIAIAIGAMVDAAIIMIENAHKHIERDGGRKPHWDIIRDASIEVGPTLFYSLLVITVSFLPVFTLQAQEGRLFKPLAFTKTYSMAAAALLSITLAPVLMGFLIRGKIPKEESNPINRVLMAIYHPFIDLILKHRWAVIGGAAILISTIAYPLSKIGSEFMPPLYEGDILYMPSLLPSVSVTKAKEILQQTDRMIKTVPEVHHVFGKAGRAETSTDPAPLNMFETTITLKPQSEWREGMTAEKIVAELDKAVQIPGVTNAWTMPIKARIDMLSTGIKTPVGVKIAGPDLERIEDLAKQVESVLSGFPGTASVYAERVMGGAYMVVDIDRKEIARYGLSIKAVQDVVQTALGGMKVTQTVEGLERYPVNLRYSRDLRSNLGRLREVLVDTPTGAKIPLGQLAKLSLKRDAPSIKTEGAIPNAWIYVDIRDIDVGTYVKDAQVVVAKAVKIPPGYSLVWSGQFEYMERAEKRLLIVIPLTLLLVFVIIYLNTKSLVKTCIVLLAVPFSLVGAFWALHFAGYNLSVAVWVGIIALAGLDAETGVVMLLYLDISHDDAEERGLMRDLHDLRDAIYHGAVKRVRPKAMTAAVIIAGLAPILWSDGAGADVMKRIALPMIGGVMTSTVMELLVYPAIYYIWRGRPLRGHSNDPGLGAASGHGALPEAELA